MTNQTFYQSPYQQPQQPPQQPQQRQTYQQRPQQGFGGTNNHQSNFSRQHNQNTQGGYHGGRSQNSNGGNQYNDQLIQVINYGFPFNHLITIALMQRVPSPNLQYPDMKEKIFFFLTLAPGVGDGQNRTYDFQQGRVSMKFATREICGLAEILKNVAIGNNHVLPYAKFTRSQSGSKTCSVWTSQKQQQAGQNNIVVNQINITISADQKQTVTLTSEQALGVGNILYKLFDKAVDLEFKLQLEQPTVSINSI